MRRALLVCALALAGCGRSQSSPASAPPADGASQVANALGSISATCARANGTVEVRRAGESAWQPLTLGAVLRAGDVVRTGPTSSARVAFVSGGGLDLEENATVEIGVTAPAQAEGGPPARKESTVSVESGVVRGYLPSGADAQDLGLVIRGADGSRARLVAPKSGEPASFRLTQAANGTELAITKGEVEVQGARGGKKVAAGHALDVAGADFGEAAQLLDFPASVEPGIDAQFQWAKDLAIRLAWKRVPKASGYRVQVASDLSFQKVIRTIEAAGTDARFSPASLGTFAWRVASRDAAGRYGEYGFARRIYCERELPRDLLVGPPDRAVVKFSDHPATVAFTWQSAASAQVYRLVVASAPDLLEHKVVSRATAGQRLEVKGLAPGEYYWGVYVDDGPRPESIFVNPRVLVVQRAPRANNVKVPKAIREWGN